MAAVANCVKINNTFVIHFFSVRVAIFTSENVTKGCMHIKLSSSNPFHKWLTVPYYYKLYLCCFIIIIFFFSITSIDVYNPLPVSDVVID